eukprot:5384233-Alexandrium_andersonii.AAC.1
MVGPDGASLLGGSGDHPGIAFLDAACQKTTHGRARRVTFERAIRSHGLVAASRSRSARSRGIGGASKSDA